MGFLDKLFGDVKEVKKSGAFQGVEEVGAGFSQEILDLLKPVGESDTFRHGSTLIRDQLGKASATARQRLGDRGASSGFSDSGVINEGLSDIDRAEFGATSSALERLILGIEDRKFSTVLPFLSAAANENLGVGTANQNASLAKRGQNLGFFESTFDFSNLGAG